MQTEKVDLNAIEKDLTGIISKIVEIGEDKLVENRDKHFFNDLGLDSLIALEIIASIEKKYRIEIEEDQLKYCYIQMILYA